MGPPPVSHLSRAPGLGARRRRRPRAPGAGPLGCTGAAPRGGAVQQRAAGEVTRAGAAPRRPGAAAQRRALRAQARRSARCAGGWRAARCRAGTWSCPASRPCTAARPSTRAARTARRRLPPLRACAAGLRRLRTAGPVTTTPVPQLVDAKRGTGAQPGPAAACIGARQAESVWQACVQGQVLDAGGRAGRHSAPWLDGGMTEAGAPGREGCAGSERARCGAGRRWP